MGYPVARTSTNERGGGAAVEALAPGGWIPDVSVPLVPFAGLAFRQHPLVRALTLAKIAYMLSQQYGIAAGGARVGWTLRCAGVADVYPRDSGNACNDGVCVNITPGAAMSGVSNNAVGYQTQGPCGAGFTRYRTTTRWSRNLGGPAWPSTYYQPWFMPDPNLPLPAPTRPRPWPGPFDKPIKKPDVPTPPLPYRVLPYRVYPAVPSWGPDPSVFPNPIQEPWPGSYPWPSPGTPGPAPQPQPWPFPWPQPGPGPAPAPVPAPGPGPAPAPGPRPQVGRVVLPVPRSELGTVNAPLRNDPPHVHKLKPPGPGVREIKVRAGAAVGLLWAAVNAVTETRDFIKSLHKALPKEYRTPTRAHGVGKHRSANAPTVQKMFQEVWTGITHMNDQQLADFTNKAVDNLVTDQFKDFVFGKIGQAQAKANRKSGRPIGYGAGPAL